MAVAQADVTGHMILCTQAPIVEGLRVRGVVPAHHGSPAVRIALGAPGTDHGLLALCEIPLAQGDEALNPWEAADRVRHTADAPPFPSADQADTVLGTPLTRLVEACPTRGGLVGFLYLPEGRMRLCVRRRGDPDVGGCDARLTQAGPAVIAEVLPRPQERELFEEPGDDPHCAAVVNLIH
ncbi:hypothetical protein ACFCYB_17950 [Streptomyces sp. NPDC056309]|uniref:hypothetical protein n=1 Tax=unclassified Streptomyces TaxID=2593676 RepID=UPI0035E2F054